MGYSMYSSILPLVQLAQVTLGHPKDVKKEERVVLLWSELLTLSLSLTFMQQW